MTLIITMKMINIYYVPDTGQTLYTETTGGRHYYLFPFTIEKNRPGENCLSKF